jgi:hypothetical protein
MSMAATKRTVAAAAAEETATTTRVRTRCAFFHGQEFLASGVLTRVREAERALLKL